MKYLLALFALSITLIATPVSAQINVVTKSITPNITLVWEASSYVPPFYKGKALMPDGGDGRIVAFLPPGITDTQNVSYQWQIDGAVDGTRSGVGRNTYEVKSEIFGGSPLIVVEVSDEKGSIGTGALRIPLSKPQALIYADAPLGGVLFNVENPRLGGAEFVVETYPLFFTTTTRQSSAMSYQWKINGFTVGNPLGNSGRLVLRGDTEAGTTTVGVSIGNKSRMLENASGQTTIFFE
jgi:hypothetical protein